MAALVKVWREIFGGYLMCNKPLLKKFSNFLMREWSYFLINDTKNTHKIDLTDTLKSAICKQCTIRFSEKYCKFELSLLIDSNDVELSFVISKDELQKLTKVKIEKEMFMFEYKEFTDDNFYLLQLKEIE